MVRPASNLRSNVQRTWRWVGSTLGTSVREDPSACLWQARHPVSAHWEEGAPNMTVSELIEELRAMPSEATVMLWSRMDDPQHRSVQRVELSTTKSDPTAEIVVLS
jgi:hypothetical protein